MLVVEELARLGGLARRQALLERCTRGELQAALRAGEVLRLARGRYALPSVGDAAAVAHALAGVLCLESAALHWGWAVKSPPELPQVAVPRTRKVDPRRVRGVDLRRLRLGPDDVVDGATSRDRTLLDCLRLLGFDAALAVVDSALREGYSPARLRALVRDARGPQVGRMRWIAELGDGAAANPFESVLRAIAHGVTGLEVHPQVSLRRQLRGGVSRFLGRPDLVDQRLRIVIEADSFQWHGGRAALRSDAHRYNGFSVDGWLVLRFAWEDVMFDQRYVADVLRAAVAERTDLLCPCCRTAS